MVIEVKIGEMGLVAIVDTINTKKIVFITLTVHAIIRVSIFTVSC